MTTMLAMQMQDMQGIGSMMDGMGILGMILGMLICLLVIVVCDFVVGDGFADHVS